MINNLKELGKKIKWFIKDLIIKVKIKAGAILKKKARQTDDKPGDFEINTLSYQIDINIHNPKKLNSFDFVPGKNNEFINTFFDNIYVINLKQRKDRLAVMLQKLKHLNIRAEIVEAINGYSHPHIDEYEQYLKIPLGFRNAHPYEFEQNRKLIISPGAWGILKTYRYILNDAKKRNFNQILVLEDDAVFIHNFHKAFKNFTENIHGKQWKIFALGATQHVWRIPQCMIYPDKAIKEYHAGQSYYHPVRTDGAFALGIHHSIYDFIIGEIDKMNCAIDSGPIRSAYKKYTQQCFVAQPNLIVADVSDSNIGPVRKQKELAANVKWDMKKYDHPFRKELVSVIMPAYNAEKTIEYSIRSLLRQSYPEIEIVVVDDGSTDRTGEIVHGLMKTDSRIVYKRFEENRGCYYVRNDGIRMSSGNYIAINDADDISLSFRIATQLIPILSGKVRFTIGRIIRSRCDINELNLENDEKILQLVNSRRKLNKHGIYDYHDREILGLVTSMFSREVFEEYGLFWEERFSSDMEFMERIFHHELNIRFPSKFVNAHDYLSKNHKVDGLFEKIEDVLLISPQLRATNLTNTFPVHGEERKKFEIRWRNKLLGKDDYQYPRLEKLKTP